VRRNISSLDATPKPYILAPCEQRFGEHVDDHQIELAVPISNRDPIAWSPGDLVSFWPCPEQFLQPQLQLCAFCQRLKNRFAKAKPKVAETLQDS